MPTYRRREDGKGRARWQAVIRLKGVPTLCSTFRSKQAARKWAESVEREHRDRKLLPRIEASRHTVAEACARYLSEVAPHRLAAQTLKDRRAYLKFWTRTLGAFTLDKVGGPLIHSARARLKVAPATTNRYLAALSAVFDFCSREWGWVEHNPCRKVRRMSEGRGRVRFLSTEERGALLKACQKSTNPVLYQLVITALASGARQGELLRLQWADVDLANRRAVLHETKNSQRRVIALSGAADVLAQMPRAVSGYVFGPSFPRKPWAAAIKASGVNDFRFHDLRHTAASYLAMSGASVPEIASFLGHKSFILASRYAHLTSEHSTELAERMADRFLS